MESGQITQERKKKERKKKKRERKNTYTQLNKTDKKKRELTDSVEIVNLVNGLALPTRRQDWPPAEKNG